MNKNDIKFIIIIGAVFIIFININKEEGNAIEVYYEDKLILSADLNVNDVYTVDGKLGDVVIGVKDRKVRVLKENSPRNICSREGYISDSSKPLICLPNKIIIKIVDSSEIDGVVY